MLAIEEEIFQASIARGVLLVKGTFFRAEANTPSTDNNSVLKGTKTVDYHGNNGAVAVTSHAADKPPANMFFRTTFAAVDEEKVMEGIRRFGGALREVFEL